MVAVVLVFFLPSTGAGFAGAALAAIVYGVITKGKEKSEPQA